MKTHFFGWEFWGGPKWVHFGIKFNRWITGHMLFFLNHQNVSQNKWFWHSKSNRKLCLENIKKSGKNLSLHITFNPLNIGSNKIYSIMYLQCKNAYSPCHGQNEVFLRLRFFGILRDISGFSEIFAFFWGTRTYKKSWRDLGGGLNRYLWKLVILTFCSADSNWKESSINLGSIFLR